MKISVVIPVYNEEKFIESCLTALERQTVKPDEVIVVDNNCTDKTVALARQHAGVRIIKEKQQGIVFARNAGFDAAEHEIIARCDADTLVPPNWVARIKKNFESDQLDAVTGPVFFYDLPYKKSLQQMHIAVYFKLTSSILKHITLFGANMALTKRIWKLIRQNVCFDERKIHEDIDLSIHIAEAGGKIRFDKQLLASTSGRRLHSSLPDLIKYLVRWSNTKIHHRNRLKRSIST